MAYSMLWITSSSFMHKLPIALTFIFSLPPAKVNKFQSISATCRVNYTIAQYWNYRRWLAYNKRQNYCWARRIRIFSDRQGTHSLWATQVVASVLLKLWKLLPIHVNNLLSKFASCPCIDFTLFTPNFSMKYLFTDKSEPIPGLLWFSFF